MLARRIIDIAKTKLNDEQGRRWPDAELLEDLNDGQRRIVTLVPSTKAANEVIALNGGPVQHLPLSMMMIAEAVRNMGARGDVPGTAITQIDRRKLDNMHPDWAQDPPLGIVTYVMYDRAVTPREFHVYPPQPQNNPHHIEVVGIRYPTDCTLADLDGVATTEKDSMIDLPENYSDALLYFLMFRGHMKDSRYAQAGHAERYFNKMLAELGLTAQQDQQAAQQSREISNETPTQ